MNKEELDDIIESVPTHNNNGNKHKDLWYMWIKSCKDVLIWSYILCMYYISLFLNLCVSIRNKISGK